MPTLITVATFALVVMTAYFGLKIVRQLFVFILACIFGRALKKRILEAERERNTKVN